MRRHVQSGAHAQRQRPEVIEKNEWTNRQSLRRRECPTDLEFVGKIAERRQYDLLNNTIRGSVRNCHYYILPARFRRRTALLLLSKSSGDTNSKEVERAATVVSSLHGIRTETWWLGGA
jgi:hypothetical protein